VVNDDPGWARPGAVPPPAPGPALPYVAPPAGYPYLPAPPVPPPLPPGVPRLRPARIEPVAGTHFGVAIPALPPTVSGLAVGSMVAGIGSIAVSLLVLCFGFAGAKPGWGALVAGAFAALGFVLGAGACGTAVAARRQIAGSAGGITGPGLATAGLTCGMIGAGLAVFGLALAIYLVRTA